MKIKNEISLSFLVLLLTIFLVINFKNVVKADEIIDGMITAQQIDEVMDELFPDKKFQAIILDQGNPPYDSKESIYQKIIDDYENNEVYNEGITVENYIKKALLGEDPYPHRDLGSGLINYFGIEIRPNSGVESLEGIQHLFSLRAFENFDWKVDDKLAPVFKIPHLVYIHLDYSVDDQYNDEFYGNLSRHDEFLYQMMDVVSERQANPQYDEEGYIAEANFTVTDLSSLIVNGGMPTATEHARFIDVNQTNFTNFELDYTDYISMPGNYSYIMYEDTYYIDEDGSEAQRDYFETLEDKEYFPMFFEEYEFSKSTLTWKLPEFTISDATDGSDYELHYAFKQVTPTKIEFILEKIIKTQAGQTIEVAIEEFDYKILFESEGNISVFEEQFDGFKIVREFVNEVYFPEGVNVDSSGATRVYWNYGYSYDYPFVVSVKLETVIVEPEAPTIIGEGAYTVEYYHQVVNNDYKLVEVENLSGLAGTVVEAYEKTYAGYSLDRSIGGTTASGRIAEDGSLVLSLYYNKVPESVVYTGNSATLTPYLGLMILSILLLAGYKKSFKTFK